MTDILDAVINGEVICMDQPPCRQCKIYKKEIKYLKEKANFTCDEVLVLARYVEALNRRIVHTKLEINDSEY